LSTPTVAPDKFTRGLTVKWIFDAGDDYRPGAGRTLTYYFTCATDHQSIVATDNGDGRFLAIIPCAAEGEGVTSSSFVAPRYHFEAWFSDEVEDEVFRLDQGWVDVEASPDANVDRRSFARKALDDIRACIAGRLPKAHVAQYAVSASGEQWSTGYVPTGADLLRVEAYFAEIVRAEDARDRQARGLPAGNRVLTEFRR
jgi:hypothetical protein